MFPLRIAVEQSILDLNPFHTESQILKFADSFRHDLAENLALKQTWQKEQETGLEMWLPNIYFP